MSNMSKWIRFLWIVFALILGGAAFFSERWLDQLRNDYQAVVEENKALKEKNKPVYKYLRLEVYSVLFSVNDHGKASYSRPLYAVRYGVIHPYSKQFVIRPHKNSVEVWEKWQIFPYSDRNDEEETINVKMLPSSIGYLKSDNLKLIEFILMDNDYNFYIYLKEGVNLNNAYGALSDLIVFYPDEYLGY